MPSHQNRRGKQDRAETISTMGHVPVIFLLSVAAQAFTAKPLKPSCPSHCLDHSHPVCGTNDVTYGSACDLQMLSCGLEVSVQHSGSCVEHRSKNRSIKKRQKRSFGNTNYSGSIRLCGIQLTMMLDIICRGRYDSYGGTVQIEKCCERSCSRAELLSFCRT